MYFFVSFDILGGISVLGVFECLVEERRMIVFFDIL